MGRRRCGVFHGQLWSGTCCRSARGADEAVREQLFLCARAIATMKRPEVNAGNDHDRRFGYARGCLLARADSRRSVARPLDHDDDDVNGGALLLAGGWYLWLLAEECGAAKLGSCR